jgi:hypothetical protein
MTLLEYLIQGKGRAAALAREIPCTQAHISKIKKGITIPSFEMAKRIEFLTGGLVPLSNWYKVETVVIGDIIVSLNP